MKPNSFYALFISCFLLTACSVIPLKTLYKLSRTDMMTVDPANIRAAVRMPDIIRPSPNGAKLTISAQQARKPPTQEIFILQRITHPKEIAALQQEQRQGNTIHFYRIQPADLSRLKSFRNKIKNLKQTRKDVTGKMGISITACSQSEQALTKLFVTNWLKLDNKSDYLATAVDYDLMEELRKHTEEHTQLLLPCP